ncbi:hypothetical protein BV22DRAFT_1123860, partial [Leucogyrophana mollusca]
MTEEVSIIICEADKIDQDSMNISPGVTKVPENLASQGSGTLSNPVPPAAYVLHPCLSSVPDFGSKLGGSQRDTEDIEAFGKRGPVPLGDQVSSGKDPTPLGGQKGKKKKQPASTVETPELISADPEIDADNSEMNTGPTDPTAQNSESTQEGAPEQSLKAAGKQPEVDVGDWWRSRDRGDALASSHGVNPYWQNANAIERMRAAVHEVTHLEESEPSGSGNERAGTPARYESARTDKLYGAEAPQVVKQEAEDPREAARRLARQRRPSLDAHRISAMSAIIPLHADKSNFVRAYRYKDDPKSPWVAATTSRPLPIKFGDRLIVKAILSDTRSWFFGTVTGVARLEKYW